MRTVPTSKMGLNTLQSNSLVARLAGGAQSTVGDGAE
jgi:hypothetical protein